MSALEILEAHKRIDAYEGPATCTCEEWESRRTGLNSSAQHRAHVAQVLDQHVREREVEALTEAADALDAKSSRLDRDYATENGAYLGLNTATTELRDRANQFKEKP